MSSNPLNIHSADNASLRPYYGQPLSYEACLIKENGIPVSAWVMRETAENRERYISLYESDNPPATRAEALERAGATFFPRWYQSEILRDLPPVVSKATLLTLKRLDRTEENVRLAEEELDENKFEFDEDRIMEERKSLQWVREEMQKERVSDK